MTVLAFSFVAVALIGLVLWSEGAFDAPATDAWRVTPPNYPAHLSKKQGGRG